MFIYWIDNKRLGGASQPFLEDLPFLKNIEISGMVCLQEKAASKEIASLLDISYLHVPIKYFSLPTERDLEVVLDFFLEAREKRKSIPVLVHCTTGHGRTGMILATLLVLVDQIIPQEAITRIRAVNPLALENNEQVKFILSLGS